MDISAEEETVEIVVPSYILKVNEVVPRVVGAITFLSSLYMLGIAWKRRQWLFHRLVFGMSTHLILGSVFVMYGNLAIPSDDASSNGTIATCTTQGFIIRFCAISAIFYYSSFSIYSYVGVLNNFKKAKIIWIEKWIHLFVHIYPFTTGIYFLSIQGYNNKGTGFCSVASAPLRCEFDPDIACERGFQDRKIMKWIQIVPQVSILLFPTIVMVSLFLMVRKRQTRIYIQAKTIAQQSFVYCFCIYWVVVPFFIRIFVHDIAYTIFVLFNYSLFGFYSMIVYQYFTIERKKKTDTSTSLSDSNANNNNSIKNHELKPNNTNDNVSSNFIFNSQEIKNDVNNGPKLRSPAAPLSRSPRYTFNIFDGTNGNGEFSDFVYAGDSDDEKVDDEESKHWDCIQDHV